MKDDYLKQCKGEGVRDRHGAEPIDSVAPGNLCRHRRDLLIAGLLWFLGSGHLSFGGLAGLA